MHLHLFEPWNLFYAVCFVVFYRIRGIYMNRTKKEKKTVRRMDGMEKALLFAMFPGTFLLPLLYLLTPLLSFADYTLPAWLPWIGAVMMIASLWLFWRSHADLGQNWSVSLEVREGHELVTNGVYRAIRHPMYASIWLWAFAQAFLLQNWLAGWSVVPAFAAMYWLRVPREEQLMIEQFGDSYREYMKHTGKVVPRNRFLRWPMVLAVMLYIGSYVVLSCTGGWVVAESGRVRLVMAMADQFQWQPRYGSCGLFRSADGTTTIRADGLGWIYAPLILLDQRFWHRTIPFIASDFHAVEPLLAPPLSEFHPLRANRWHGRFPYEEVASHAK